MRSAGRSTSADASVAPLATTTYDPGYSINGGMSQITNRRNAGDPFGGGTLPENPIEPGTPVGDVPWLFILCMSLAYALLRFRKRIATLFMLCIIATASYAVPARPGWQTKTQPDGTTIEVRLTGDEFYHYWQDRSGNVVKCDSLGYWRVVESQPTPATIKARRQASRMLQSRPNKAVGSVNLAPRGLVILVNFSDSKFANANNQAAMNELMNSDNYTYNGATGSVRQFFSDQSDGQYTPDFDVIGPVTLSENVAYYGGNDAGGGDLLPGDMVVEACSIANASHGVDFTQYDNDGDGYVDFVYIVYAGKGEADGGADETIWPHNWDLASAYYYDNCTYNKNKRRFDGKYINNYACSGELSGAGARTGIGTIAHEFGHVIGLPDLYDIDYGQNSEDEATPGAWHIMDGGSYNNDGKTPPNYTIYDKYFLGWETPTNPSNTPQTLTLQAAGTDGFKGYQIATSNSLLLANNTNTVYYIENRQQSGWDAYLPGHGLVIWKIMYSQSVWEANGPNDTDGTIRYAIVSASGKTTGIGTGADPFPGTKKKTRWEGVSGKPLLDITESGGVITLTYIDDAECHSVLTNGTSCTITPSSDCVANGATLTANITPTDASYDITSVSVKLGSTTLTNGTDFTLSNNNQFITIKGTAITGDASNSITITATATKARWTYEVLYENATVSSETGAVAKGGTITLTVTPALGYVLTEENIEVEIDGVAKNFTYSGTTLTIPNVTGDVAIYIMPEIDPNNAITFTRLTNTAMLKVGAQCILVYAETPAVAGQLVSNTYLESVTTGFTVNGTEITTQKTNTDISIFTLGGSTGAWILTNSEGKKLSGTEKTLVWNGTNSTWTINVGDDGKTIMTVGGTQLYYNSSSPRFRTYTSAQKGLYLYVSQTGEIVKQDPVITFSKAGNQTTKVNQPFSNPATTTYGTITYSSNDETTATVNSSGVVTPKKAGTVTITASVAEGTYNHAASASYQLTITDLAKYTVTWMANGSQFANVAYTEGDKLALPTETPDACTNTKQFVGWTTATNRDYEDDTQAPEFITAGEEVTANATYYAVYALEKAGSANVVTTTMTNFTATAANMDSYISYAAAQGTATAPPAINNGEIRIYQNGGTLTVTAKTGAKINSITIGSSMATSVTYKADAGSTSAAQSISANGTFTKSGLDASSVLFTCKGTTTSSRLYLNRLEVTYTAGNATTYMYYSTDCSGEIDDKQDPIPEFAEANKVLTIGDTYTNTLTLTYNSTGEKTFTSSDVNVATVAANGQVTALAAGNTTITVAIAAVPGQFSAATASYNITVVRKKATPSFAKAQIDLKTGESQTVEVNKGEHDGEVAYTSADPAIATVDPVTGQVLGVSAGFTTITATLAQTATYETATATYMVYVSSEMVSDDKFGVTWIADGIVLTDTEATHRYTSGEGLKMPSTEVGGTNGKEFVGWTAIKDYQNPFCPPEDLFSSPGEKTVTANITYYAVYKTK
ncbi:MAG: M6 family metalloprotease domain-containing protein [Paludibacteraceae bacterium]|nr:M6 family metalloprotease domain-containing protein [Paludibacteraceae bacterium]